MNWQPNQRFQSLPQIPVNADKVVYWPTLSTSANALALLEHLATSTNESAPKVVLVVTETVTRATELYQALEYFGLAQEQQRSLQVLLFPDYETLPYDVFSPNQDLISERLQLLQQLVQIDNGSGASTTLVVSSITSLLQRLPPKQFIIANSFNWHCQDKINISELSEAFAGAGYQSVTSVREHGEFCVRGSLLDIFPMGSQQPLRLDFFDDELESIRLFDPETQLTIEKVDSFQLLPAHEFILNKVSIARFKNAWHETFEEQTKPSDQYKLVSQGRSFPGIEYYLPLLHEQTMSLLDYLPSDSLLIQTQRVQEGLEAFWKQIQRRYDEYSEANQRQLIPPNMVFMPANEWFAACKKLPRIELNSTRSKLKVGIDTVQEAQLLFESNQPYEPLKALIAKGQQVLFCAANHGRREVLINTLARAGITPTLVENWQNFEQQALNQAGDQQSPEVALGVASLVDGFHHRASGLMLITENELLGSRGRQAETFTSKTKTKHASGFNQQEIIRSLLELQLGDAVVHIDHGVGLYRGLELIAVGGREEEFLTLQYANDDKLYVPIASLHLISRYNSAQSGDDGLTLHRLGGEQWTKVRNKATKSIRDTAAELLEIYARRETKKGVSLTSAEAMLQQFSSEFTFDETSDQLRAIEAIKVDMERPRPMDRLVCGDVGFGKTEVAMRAAFIAVMAKKQVLVLVPTTLLANQHFETFLERFNNWPVGISSLSRLQTAKEQNQLCQQFKGGKIDILIGTHKLLFADLDMQNVGLLVIDEEHRFGVRQKEKLKAMRAEIDILALTATPIPRTLNMAMSALRDLSIIAEPPARRLAVKTFVCVYDLGVIKEALEREILRGGQVYFLHNEIRTINRTAEAIAKLLPEAKVVVGHGQMRERELEQVMFDFHHQRFNVLVCSTIIETGIDIPNANTIIMERADKLGLAQLHQLRGRVGRSHHQAYAYLLTPELSAMSKDAHKRLQAITAADHLGSGFTLATHDLEIRGAGELLGENQSGQIHAIGFELFREMLDKAVRDLRSGKSKAELLQPAVDINFNLSALIPNDYLPDVNLRLSLYKRIASTTSEAELEQIQIEMIDRFGLLPNEVNCLFEVTHIRQQAEQMGISKINGNDHRCKLWFHQNTSVEPMRIVNLIQQQPQCFQMEGATAMAFTGNDQFSLVEPQQRIMATQWLLQLLTGKARLEALV